jgi:mycofactocin precursor
MAHPVTDTPAAPAAPTGADRRAQLGEELVEDELLVEEVSIDGMCGVY